MFHLNEFDVNNKACYSDLYDRIQKIHYRIGGRNDKLSLNIKISVLVRYGFNDEKILKIVITDNDNPLMLFSTEIDADVYSKLKQKLGLLIDFSQFPQQLVGLLSQCCDEGDLLAPKYDLTLEEENCDPYDIVEGRCIIFRIVETNQFQKLCLVALHMVCGSEAEVNSFLARSIQLLKQKIDSLEAKAAAAEERCAEVEGNLNAKTFETERLRAQLGEQVKSIKRKHDEEIQSLKQDHDSLKDVYERKIRQTIREQEEKHRSSHVRLEEALEKRKSEANSLKAANDKLEGELTEKNESLSKLRGDIRILQDEILKSENKISRLEADAKEKNMFVVSLKQRVSHLEKEKEDKDKAIRKLTSLLEAGDANRNHLKTVLKEKLQLIESQKEDLNAVTKDLFKANEIISKVTKENRQIKDKLVERTKIVLEQEKVIAGLQSNLSTKGTLTKEKCERIRTLEEENVKLNDLLKSSEEKVKSKEEIIQKNERVIGWLNDIVSKHGASKTQGGASSKSANLATPGLPAADPYSVEKKLMQMTANSADSSKSNTVNRKTTTKGSMRGK